MIIPPRIKSVLLKIKAELLKLKYHFLYKSILEDVLKKVGNGIIESDDFKNNNINKCFEERKLKTSNLKIVERIIKAYNKAREAQIGLPAAYQVGNEWLPIYKYHMRDIMSSLGASDIDKTNKIYENFVRENCSVGLHGLPIDMNIAYFKGKITKVNAKFYLHDAIYRYYHWKKLTNNKFPAKDLYMPDYGNPYGFYIGEQFIRAGAEYLHYYATRIADLINDETERKVVVEIGGGYGGLAYFLNKTIENFTYIDFDLPENMALTAYYVMNSFPGKKVLLYGEGELTEENINRYDIIIMPNFEIKKLPSQKINLAFNSYSLAEMSAETINVYIPELKRASKKYIFHVNHTVHSNSLTADEFGIEDEKFKLLSREPALWNMGRNSNMDEFEYLYAK